MTVYEAAKTRRTVRRFRQDALAANDISEILDAARLAPFGANLQPLKYRVITDEEIRRKLFPLIKYAGYIPDWDPVFEECPPVFIAIMNDTNIKPTDKSECDSGAAIMSMCLVAQSKGIGSCWLGAIDRAEIKKTLELPENLDLTYMLGLGIAAQEGEVFDMKDSVKYYFDDTGNVHVPKRTADEIMV